MATILLVDDQPESCEPVVEFLERAGHTVKQSSGPWHALAALPAILPDVIIADIRMPQMNGFAFLRELREDPFASRVPVILLTGVADPDLRWRASDMGIERVFLKGDYDLIDLLKCINGLVEDEGCPPPVMQHLIPTMGPAKAISDQLPAI